MSEPPVVSLSPSSSDSLSCTISSLRINEPTADGGGPLNPIGPVPEDIQRQLRSSSPPHHQNENPQPKLKSILPSITSCPYTSCYCEENIWMLCDKIRTEYFSELDHCTVAFISNPKRMIPLWRQKAGKTEDKLVYWDYHTILLYNPDDRCVVYDLDSDLPFPTHFHKYVTETFRTDSKLQPEYHRFFRVIPAKDFLNLFSSNRAHMVRADGSFISQPPPYPPIYRNGVNNLDEFLDMTISSSKNEYGEVLPLMDLVRRFYKQKRAS